MMQFACVGLDHGHIFGLTEHLISAGGHLAAYSTEHDAQAVAFEAAHPGVPRRSTAEIMEDASIGLVASAAIPSDRAALAIRAMEAGKDALLDKPGVVHRADLDRLAAVQAATGRRVRVVYSELEECASVQTALAMVRNGAIGRLVHYCGAGPHRLSAATRPDWFFDRGRNGGILNDIASHQFACFVSFAGAPARIAFARVATSSDIEGFQNLGEVMMEAGGVSGYARVDWHTPNGLPTWGDGRMVFTGTKGVLEIRKYVDVAQPGGESPLGEVLILTDDQGPRRVPCNITSPFYEAALADAANGTETAMSQDLAFHIMDLTLTAQEMAEGRL